MKTNLYFLLFTLILFASCSSLQQSAVNDDLYYSPKDEPVGSNINYYNQSPDLNMSASSDGKHDKEISAILENESIEDIDTVIYQSEDDYENPYESIVVDSYEESQQRRLDALRGAYGMHSNYFITLSDDYWYAQAYFNDPFYNVVVYGNNIWVEPYWMSSWYSYGYSFYRPYYSYNPYYSYGNYGFYYPYYDYPYYSSNDNYASSSFHSYRQRSLAGTSGTRSSVARSSRDLPESYTGRDISGSSTVKSGIDRTSSRVSQSGTVRPTNRVRENNIAGETIRLKETNTGGSGVNVRTTNRQTQTGATSAASRNYTRPKQSARSTYNSPSSTSSRYNRPESTSVSSGRSSSGAARTSGSSTVRSGSSNSKSGSSYSPSRSTGSSGNSSIGRSSGNSGSSRSSGSSTRSSGSSSRSSGSSSNSSGSSSRGGRR